VVSIGILRFVKWFGKTDFTGDLVLITTLFLNCQVARGSVGTELAMKGGKETTQKRQG
jgi:hypothetical protein